MHRTALIIGCITAMLAVMLGAFGAHALKEMIAPDQLVIYEKGVTYQFYHSFALLASGILYREFPHRFLRMAVWFFSLGILFFSGSLYLLVALKTHSMSIGPAGIITPIGGLCFVSGWMSVLIGLLNKKTS